jgi:hypothetical protein
LCYTLTPAENAVLITVAKRHIEELELEPEDDLPAYLQDKLSALRELVANGPDELIQR